MGEVKIGCPSETDEIEGAVDSFLWSNSVEELNEAVPLRNIAWRDVRVLFQAEERDEFGNPNNGARADIAGGRLLDGCFESEAVFSGERCSRGRLSCCLRTSVWFLRMMVEGKRCQRSVEKRREKPAVRLR